MFHQVNGMIGFASNSDAQREMILEYVRKVLQQHEDVRVGGCISVLDGLGDRFTIDYAILGEVYQAFNLCPVLRVGFNNSRGIHIRGGRETRITRWNKMEARGICAGGRLVRRSGEAAGP